MKTEKLSKELQERIIDLGKYEKDLNKIKKLLEKVREHNNINEVEVIYCALEEMRFNNTITPVMAMMSACKEWDI
jgi:hypothetical protein